MTEWQSLTERATSVMSHFNGAVDWTAVFGKQFANSTTGERRAIEKFLSILESVIPEPTTADDVDPAAEVEQPEDSEPLNENATSVSEEPLGEGAAPGSSE